MTTYSPRVRGRGLVLLIVLVSLQPSCSDGFASGGSTPGFQTGDTVPGRIHIVPHGSRADIEGKGQYANGEWTVEIRRLLDTGNPDDALFEVGVDEIFGIAVADDGAAVHDGAARVRLLWGAGSPSASAVVAADLDAAGVAAPVIDGDASDAAWGLASASVVSFSPQAGTNGIANAVVQAAWTNDTIYYRVTWRDPDSSVVREQWLWDGARWQRGTEDEDRLYLMFDVHDSRGTSSPGATAGTRTRFSIGGCAIACHGDGRMRLDAGRADVWRWQSTRTDPSGFLEDHHLRAAPAGASGLEPDVGSAAYTDNVSADGRAPRFRSARGFSTNPGSLFLVPSDCDFAAAKASDDGYEKGDTLPGYVSRIPRGSRADVRSKGVFVDGRWTVEFSRPLDTGHTHEWGSPVRFRKDDPWKDGDRVPGYVVFPPTGNLGDVRAEARWKAGYWTLEIGRALDSGRPGDAAIVPGAPITMAIAVVDDSSRIHDAAQRVTLAWSGFAEDKTIVAADLGARPAPVIDGSGNEAAWAHTQTSVVTLMPIPHPPKTHGHGLASVQVQAAYTATDIYLKLVWQDPTESNRLDEWTRVGETWRRKRRGEDRLYVMLDIDGTGTSRPTKDDGLGVTPFASKGCTVACHGDGVMRLDGGTVDFWSWQAARNGGSGRLEDGHLNAAASGVSGCEADDGWGLAVRNSDPSGAFPSYQAFGDPGASADHLFFAPRSSPDDGAFIVGRDIPFALALTDSDGRSHDGAPLLWFRWSGNSSPTDLVALDLIEHGLEAPIIDGSASDPVWGRAVPSQVVITPQLGAWSGITTAELRAAYDLTNLHILVSWEDPTATPDVRQERRVFDGAAWSTVGARDEDRVHLAWPITEALGTRTPGTIDGGTTPFRDVGCAMACHGDGAMRTAVGRLDVWSWMATQTNAIAFADDGYVRDTPRGGRGYRPDDGIGCFLENGTGDAPIFQAESGSGLDYVFLLERPSGAAQPGIPMSDSVKPHAYAGPDRVVHRGRFVTLDGSASVDPDGDVLRCSWVQVGGPPVALHRSPEASSRSSSR
jgi:hypothetical protein